MKISCIIIEDEPLALERAKADVQKLPFLNLLATFDNALDALTFLKNNAVESGKNFIKIKLTGPAKNIKGIGTTAKLMQGSQIQTAQSMQSRGLQSSVDSDIIFDVPDINNSSLFIT